MESSRQGTEFGNPLEDPGKQSVSNIFRIEDRRSEQTVRTGGHYAVSLASVLSLILANRFLVSKKFLEYAPRWSEIVLVSLAAVSTRVLLSFLPSPPLLHPSPISSLRARLIAAPLPGAAPPRVPNPSRNPVEPPHSRARASCSGIALIRYRTLRRSRARALPPAPYTRAWGRFSLQPRGHRSPPPPQPGSDTECKLSAWRRATASPPSPHHAGHCRFHQDGLCVEQLEKSGYSLYFGSACLRRTRKRDPDSAIVHHFTCGTYACFTPRSFLRGGGGSKPVLAKSTWMIFGTPNPRAPPPLSPPSSPLCFPVYCGIVNNASFAPSGSFFGLIIRDLFNLSAASGVKVLPYCSCIPVHLFLPKG